ncbi:hypothetical protein B296_00026956, partial [Ensete ventricosum]
VAFASKMPLGQRPGDKSESRYCGVETEFHDDMPHLLTESLSGGFDFIVAPLVGNIDPSYRPSSMSNGGSGSSVLPVAASDLILSPSQWSSHVVGKLCMQSVSVLFTWYICCSFSE